MESNLNEVIALATSHMTYANLIIVIAALIIATITILLTILYNRDKRRLIQETTHNILQKISDNEQMRNDFINKILENKNFKQELERILDVHISNKMDRLVDEKQEKSNIGGFE